MKLLTHLASVGLLIVIALPVAGASPIVDDVNAVIAAAYGATEEFVDREVLPLVEEADCLTRFPGLATTRSASEITSRRIGNAGTAVALGTDLARGIVRGEDVTIVALDAWVVAQYRTIGGLPGLADDAHSLATTLIVGGDVPAVLDWGAYGIILGEDFDDRASCGSVQSAEATADATVAKLKGHLPSVS